MKSASGGNTATATTFFNVLAVLAVILFVAGWSMFPDYKEPGIVVGALALAGKVALAEHRGLRRRIDGDRKS